MSPSRTAAPAPLSRPSGPRVMMASTPSSRTVLKRSLTVKILRFSPADAAENLKIFTVKERFKTVRDEGVDAIITRGPDGLLRGAGAAVLLGDIVAANDGGRSRQHCLLSLRHLRLCAARFAGDHLPRLPAHCERRLGAVECGNRGRRSAARRHRARGSGRPLARPISCAMALARTPARRAIRALGSDRQAFTTSTAHLALPRTRSETLPSSDLPKPVRPWLPTTMRSARLA